LFERPWQLSVGLQLLPPGPSVRLDRWVGRRVAVLGGVTVGSLATTGDNVEPFRVWNVRLVTGFDVYGDAGRQQGFFAGPRLRWSWWDIRVRTPGGVSSPGQVQAMQGGAVVGWRQTLPRGFTSSIAAGGQWFGPLRQTRAVGTEGDPVPLNFTFSGFFPLVEVHLGWCF
jgi:hypothetical protein